MSWSRCTVHVLRSVFDTTADDIDLDERSTSAPLLPRGERDGSLVEEIDELLRSQGPASAASVTAVKGTLLDGVANVRVTLWTLPYARLVPHSQWRLILDGQFDHWSGYHWVCPLEERDAGRRTVADISSLPYAVSQAGFFTGVTLLIALAALTDWYVVLAFPSLDKQSLSMRSTSDTRTIRLVVLNAKLSGQDSYTNVMHHCFGHAGSAAVSFFQFAFAFGGMCAFNVII